MPNQTTLAQRVSSSFSNLISAAADLNSVSDELGKAIAQIDVALKNLNLGITVWVQINKWDHGEIEDFDYWYEKIGYAKTNGKWGVSLKRTEGNHRNPDGESSEVWLFNDGPRSLRLEAIDKIPLLIEHLSTQATVATKEIQEKLADVKAVADILGPPETLPRVESRVASVKAPQKDAAIRAVAVRPANAVDLSVFARSGKFVGDEKALSEAMKAAASALGGVKK